MGKIALDILKYNRIIIVGNNGSGKSFLSKKLADITDLPLIHLDLYFWGPNWEMPPKDEWIKKQKEFIANDRWIIDGNHNSITLDLRFSAADLVIFLDINRLVCLASVLKRHGKKRSDMPHHLKDKIDANYFKFLKGLLDFPNKRKPIIMDLQMKYSNTTFISICSRRKMRYLLNEWQGSNV